MGRVRSRRTREFKIEAVRQMESGKYPLTELSRRLSVGKQVLCAWRKEYAEKKDDAFPGQGKKRGEAGEVERLRRENQELKEEREILKKAAAYFARELK